MKYFPLLLMIAPVAVVALLTICFGQKAEKKPAMIILTVIVSCLIDYVIWWLNHRAAHSN